MSISKLTKEQEEKIPFYFNKWNKIGKEYKKIDQEKAKKLLTKYLGYANIKTKYFIFLDSPFACNLAINILHKTDFFKKIQKNSNKLRSQLGSQLYSQLRSQLRSQLGSQLGSQLRSQLGSQLGSQLYSQLRSQLGSQLYSQLDSQLYSQLDSQLRSQLDSQLYSQLRSQLGSQKLDYYAIGWFYQSANINSGYNSFYDFIIEEILKPDEKTQEVWETFKEISEELHYFFVFENIVFCSEKPTKLEFKGNRLHCENNAALQYKDGYSMYMWEGVRVPEQLIINPESITKKDILAIENAEIRRCYMEKLGAMKYYNLLSDNQGCKLIDSTIDNQGNIMKLWETIINDDIINKKVQFLECECPSTGRIYNIYPPNQKSKTCWEAKMSTFSNEKLSYRHGDVGLKIIGKNENKQILIET